MARSTKKAPEEHPFYHDTWKLLKNYRDVAWNLEIADLDLQAEVRRVRHRRRRQSGRFDRGRGRSARHPH